MDNSATQEFEFLDFTDINDMERGRLLHMLYSARNESWVSGEDGFKHPDFPWTFRGTQPQALPPPGLINEVGNITHISDWNTAADEYDCGYPTVNGDAEPENPVMINGGNFVPGPPPVYQMVPNPPVYMGNVPPPVHGYVPSQMSPYQQPMYPGPEPPMDPNLRRPNISRNPKGIPPPPNVKRNNDIAYRHPDNMEMANYQSPPTYIAVPPPHYYYSPQNSPLYLPPHHPTYPMYTHPHPTLYNPYQPPGPPMYHSPPAGQVPQQPLLVESCKPNVNPIPPVHNIYPQVPENVNETPVEPEIMSIPQDKEVELQVQPQCEVIDIIPAVTRDERLVIASEMPIVVETIPLVESCEQIKEPLPNKTKKKKEPAPNIPSNVVQEIQKPQKEEPKTEDVTPVVEFKEETPLNQEQASSSSIPPVVIPEVKDTEPVKPVFKTWAGLFTGCASTSNDKVFTLHGSSQPTTNANTESIIMPSRILPDNTIRTSVFVTNNNQKQTLPVKPRPPSSNSISSVDDNTLHLQRLGEFLSVYNLDHKTAHLQPRGLTNRNTRCYINATLQALLTCPPFFNLMRSVQFKLKNRNNRGSQKSQTPILESMVQFIGEFQQLSIKNGRTTQQQRQATSVATQETPDTGPAFEPSYVYKILPAFEEGRQEDAEEFMSYLLNGINDEMIELIKMSKSNISNGETQAEVDAIDNNNEWKEVNGKHKMVTRRTVMEKTPLSEIFRGQLRTRTVKNGENEPTENIEPFFTLKLDIEKAKSVREALDMLVNKDTLEGLTCPKTNRELDAYQQVTIDELPYVLLLHLKCFEYKQQKLTKIVKNVEFSVDLKIEPRLISKNSKINMKTRQYKLFAVVYHDGKEANKGHYFADVFYVALGRWLRFDDASVRFVTDKEVCQPKPPCMPYLLYYRRNDTIAALSAFDNKGR
ncbi:ubiquitin carboxyl-terminal hydrolase 10 isoform X1 [Metopolophium dirhodum]|uniref:ubiquitin carboxyl-terminal hydrolase 10 isoform X1 n=1 Tax=Metopolophium dirhodum TaxID=44670 RepID=UPI00298FC40D|nr:ubiquitin carboxyl-terminal hydrolase 10 isoform X1 [Metopolophium dirhodum]XP_060876559.1 ubiquitin carboxyl-terminal hydrolase 10 isoform X1 [Metopolophium dirhodum]